MENANAILRKYLHQNTSRERSANANTLGDCGVKGLGNILVWLSRRFTHTVIITNITRVVFCLSSNDQC